jgi:predicted nucleic acid-binding protein
MIVIDCSLVIAGTLLDEVDKFAEHVLQKLADNKLQAVVPALFYMECANVLLTAYKKKRITKAQWNDYQDTIAILPIDTDYFAIQSQNLVVLSSLAEKYSLTIYDAAYLELAKRMGAKLATLDKELNNAATEMKVVYHMG